MSLFHRKYNANIVTSTPTKLFGEKKSNIQFIHIAKLSMLYLEL